MKGRSVRTITKDLSDEEIKEIVNRLAQQPMRRSSHEYKEGDTRTIGEVAKKSSRSFTKNAKEHPAIALMDVVLAANRDYEKQVTKHVQRMREEWANLTLKKLQSLLKKHD